MTDRNRYQERLAAGGPALAAFCNIPDLLAAEALAIAGFDLVIVDLQHGGGDLGQLQGLLLAVERQGAAAFARVAWNQPQDIMRALDMGAGGIVVPMVETAAQARTAAEAMRYPPEGVRSYGPMRAGAPGPEAANRTVQCFPMIETVAGLDQAAAIAAVPGVDGLFVGLFDLALSMGLGLADVYRSETVWAALGDVVAAAKANGCLVGTIGRGKDLTERMFELGVDWVAVGNDKAFVIEGAKAAIAPWLPR